MGFIPGSNKLTVKQSEALEQKNGIYLPENAKEKPAEGVVIHSNALEYNSDDIVLFGKYAGTVINVDGEELLLLEVDEILGKRV